MNTRIFMAFVGATLALSACSKTPEQRFEAMYEEQKATDPEMAAKTAKAYQYRDNISDQDKLIMVGMWEEMQKARTNAGVKPKQ